MSETLSRAKIIRALVDRHVADAPDSLIVALLNLEPAGIGHNQPPEPIDPENLIDYEGLPALLAANYAPLEERKGELLGLAVEWQKQHVGERGLAIRDDADQAATSDVVAQLDTFLKDETGEVDAARRRVKKGPWEATKRIDAFFKALAEPVAGLRGAIAEAQNAYTRAQVARAQQLAAEEAERRRQEEEAAKPKVGGLFNFDDEEPAAPAAPLPAAPAPLTSDIGTTTFARGTWKAELTDLKALAQAVLDGKQPASFIMPNWPVINASVKGKQGIRDCPGLRIFQEHTTGRRS